MKKDKGTMTALLSKLKTDTIGIEHRSPIAKILHGTGEFVVYKLAFDDYGDLLIDDESLDMLLETQVAILTSYPHFENRVDGTGMPDDEYEAYKEYLAIKAIREFIGV